MEPKPVERTRPPAYPTRRELLAGEIRGLRFSTAQSYDFKDTAEFVAAQVKEQATEPIYLGVFYDPQREPTPSAGGKDGEAVLREALQRRRKSAEERRDDSKKLLRQQAQDFVAWLKEQKAIP